MNYAVHSVMYGYFTVRAMGWRVPLIGSIVVTFLQTMQMGWFARLRSSSKLAPPVLGLVICSTALGKKRENVPCQMSYFNISLCLTMYATYFLLFSKFFADNYVWPKERKNLKKTE